jgi:superfamily II DNA or RNA helicase
MKIFQKEQSETEIKLYPLQEKAIKECRKNFEKHTKRLILKASCGFGKTILACFMIKEAQKKNKNIKIIFIVDRIVLAEQTSKVFNKYGVKHGILQADNPHYYPDRNIQIGSIQTINRRKINYNFGLIIIDEVHCFYQAHKTLLKKNPDAFILGLTATPYTKGLGKYFDFFIEPFTIDEMIENKVLCPYEIYGPTVANLSELKTVAGEFTEESAYNAFGHAHVMGDIIKTWKEKCLDKKTILFGVNIKHIKEIAEDFNNNGISAVQINAYQSKEERNKNLDAFINGDVKVLCSVEVAVKGFDCPSVEVVALAVPTKSHMKWEQTVGRGLRTSPETNKEKAIILDFGGNCQRLGWPNGEHFFELDNGKRKKKKKEKLPVPCPRCSYMFLRQVGDNICPNCGFKIEPQQQEIVVDLSVELKKLEPPKKFYVDQKDYRYKSYFLAALNYYAAKKNYKRTSRNTYQWAILFFKEMFGHYPIKINLLAKRKPNLEILQLIRKRNAEYGIKKK